MTSERLALVTGTSGAIGGAIAGTLSTNGWSVVGVDVRPSHIQSSLAEEVIGDVSLAETWNQIDNVLDCCGDGLHGFVHAAATQICMPFQETKESDWDRLMAVNLKAVLLAGRVLHARLAQAKGAIVGLGSVHAFATSENIAAYAASKGGLSALMRALAIEWAKDGIRVNSVLPGAVDSEMLRSGLMRGHLNEGSVDQRLSELSERTVIGRIGQPFEVAEMVRFLLDPSLSSFITGADFVVDGGALSRLSTE